MCAHVKLLFLVLIHNIYFIVHQFVRHEANYQIRVIFLLRQCLAHFLLLFVVPVEVCSSREEVTSTFCLLSVFSVMFLKIVILGQVYW